MDASDAPSNSLACRPVLRIDSNEKRQTRSNGVVVVGEVVTVVVVARVRPATAASSGRKAFGKIASAGRSAKVVRPSRSTASDEKSRSTSDGIHTGRHRSVTADCTQTHA